MRMDQRVGLATTDFVSSLVRSFAGGLAALAVTLIVTPIRGECPTAEQVRQLVAELGDDRFSVREAATRELLGAGREAVDPLRQAAGGRDLEVTVRSVALLRQLYLEADPSTSAAAGDALRALISSPRAPTAHYAHRALRSRHNLAVWQLRSLGADVRHETRSDEVSPGLRVSINDRWQGGDGGLQPLADVEDLTRLSLKRAAVSPDAAMHLRRLSRVEWLSLEDTTFGDDQLAEIAGLTSLRRLYLGDSRVTGAGLVHLSGLRELEYLSLKNLRVGDTDIRCLEGLPKLSQLGLDETKLTNAGLVEVAKLRGLQTLWINSAQVTDAGLAPLADLSQLRSLYIADTKLTGEGLSALVGRADLVFLSCTNATVNDAGLEQIAKFTNLQTLLLDGSQVTDEGLRHLAALKRLQSLWLQDTKISDAGLKHLYGLTDLATLRLNRSKVTAAGIAELNEALPNAETRR